MLALRHWSTDYGHGPKRWFVVNRADHALHAPLTACLRHPVRAWRWIIRGIASWDR